MSALWYATRAFGLVSMVLLSAVVVLGLLVAGRRPPAHRGSYVLSGLHRSLSLVAVSLIALHVVTSAADSYVPIRWVDVFVPFASAYRPLWLGLGVMAADVLIALVVTSLLRTRLGRRTWRAVHWSAYASWPVAVVHALGIGTDGRIVLALTVVCAGAVALAAARRVALTTRPVLVLGEER
ncbi:ferric reductase-like transmembrane domain-containing protein [Actinomadura sp. DC4]|uniref:ferric reductase-like transmembrane domain-containing protein n=1 Tax=Actinomadura sp. DC4 TaxID=3055069 RepID=UPI0025AFA2B7|nr:ferric reductase-like transmembrane domain-containing protein [Actinomadura sp. DC4]MDN3354309.1 ferric reductase-like transmembrane domain-containing protein [Actinomadura sp. DC4]